MLFKPRGRMCDTWIFPHEGHYHLFWLQDLKGGSDWSSIGMAESADLVHWNETGTAVSRAADAESWMGTGRTWRAGERFILNWSEFRRGMLEEIHFAESRDLRRWTRLPPEMASRPDPRWYATRMDEVAEEFVRWDLLCPILDADGGVRQGVVTCQSKTAPAGAQYVVGHLVSPDGIRWQATAPAGVETFPIGDISGHASIGGRHYVFISIWDHWGPRYDRFSSGQQGNGMWYLVADRPEGPYSQPAWDNLLHGQRCDNPPAHFGTAFKDADRWRWNHGCVDTNGHIWLGPVKELVEESPGHLALYYDRTNDRLRQTPLWQDRGPPAPELPKAHHRLCAEWSWADGTLEGKTEVATGLALWRNKLREDEGLVVEMEMDISRDGYAGLFFGGDRENPVDGLACLLCPAGRAMMGYTTMGRVSPRLLPVEDFAWPAFTGKTVKLLAIARSVFVELYADGRLVRTMRMKKDHTLNGAFGVWIDRCRTLTNGIKAWKWKL